MVRPRKPPSPTWRDFLENHVKDLVSVDFFLVPTVSAPRSPWQNPFAERAIGGIRRERLDHVIVLNEHHVRRLLGDYLAHYHRWRCHRSL